MHKNSQINAIKISTDSNGHALKLEKRSLKAPKPDEVLIKIAYAGVNGPDILQAKGLYRPTKENILWPGLEVSGEIIALGAKVKDFKLGDKIVALCNGAGYANFINLPATQVLPLPKGWSLIEGATIAETFFTIMQTLVMRSRLKKHMFVLVHGASGGIGGSAIQIANFYGARPIAIISSQEKAEYVKSLGAEFIINYKQEDFVARTLEITNGVGADRVIDIIGGEIFYKNIKASAKNAKIMLLGLLGGAKAEINLAPILLKNLDIFGSTLGPQSKAKKAQIAKKLKKDIWAALEEKTIKPPHIKIFNLDEANLAHEYMRSKQHFGKIVLKVKF